MLIVKYLTLERDTVNTDCNPAALISWRPLFVSPEVKIHTQKSFNSDSQSAWKYMYCVFRIPYFFYNINFTFPFLTDPGSGWLGSRPVFNSAGSLFPE